MKNLETSAIKMTKPITPEEVARLKFEAFPDWVFEAINACIAAKWNGLWALVYQKDIMTNMQEFSRCTDNSYFINQGYLDFEDAYRETGWKVTFTPPEYGQNHNEAFFTFERAQ
jgi:hypothetical protein